MSFIQAPGNPVGSFYPCYISPLLLFIVHCRAWQSGDTNTLAISVQRLIDDLFREHQFSFRAVARTCRTDCRKDQRSTSRRAQLHH